MLDFIESSSAGTVLEETITGRFRGKIALVSSFGTELRDSAAHDLGNR